MILHGRYVCTARRPRCGFLLDRRPLRIPAQGRRVIPRVGPGTTKASPLRKTVVIACVVVSAAVYGIWIAQKPRTRGGHRQAAGGRTLVRGARSRHAHRPLPFVGGTHRGQTLRVSHIAAISTEGRRANAHGGHAGFRFAGHRIGSCGPATRPPARTRLPARFGSRMAWRTCKRAKRIGRPTRPLISQWANIWQSRLGCKAVGRPRCQKTGSHLEFRPLGGGFRALAFWCALTMTAR